MMRWQTTPEDLLQDLNREAFRNAIKALKEEQTRQHRLARKNKLARWLAARKERAAC